MPTFRRMQWYFALLMPGFLYASGQDHGINWWHFGSQYKDSPALGWLTITFLIFIYGCVHAIKKPLSLYLEIRSKDIRRQIEEGMKAKAQSEEKLRSYEEKLKSLSSEIEKMKTAFKEQAEAEKTESLRTTRESENRIVQDIEDTIKAIYERNKNHLAEEAVEKAVLLAQKIIAEEKRTQVDRALKSSFINDLEAIAKEVRL